MVKRLHGCRKGSERYAAEESKIKLKCTNMIVVRHGKLNILYSGNIPVFLQIILNLLIELRKALEVNMTTNTMEVKMHISAGDNLDTHLATKRYMITPQWVQTAKESITLNHR
jgi:hypothetical protein